MTAFYLSAAVVLLLTIVLGLGHVFRQPGRAESLLAALLFGSTGVALVLVLGKGLGVEAGRWTSPWCSRCWPPCWEWPSCCAAGRKMTPRRTGSCERS